MQTRLLWRRSATALGLYGSVALGFLAGIVAARRLGPDEYGLFTLAIFAAGVFQLLLDLTVEEVMIKYGFRYTTGEQWGRLRTLYRRAMVLKTARRRDRDGRARDPGAVRGLDLQRATACETPFLLAALLPVSYIPEAPAGAALVLAGRYDVRAWYVFLTQLLRATGLIVGAQLRRDRGRARPRARSDRRLDRGQLGGAQRVPPVPRGGVSNRSARTARRSSGS